MTSWLENAILSWPRLDHSLIPAACGAKSWIRGRLHLHIGYTMDERSVAPLRGMNAPQRQAMLVLTTIGRCIGIWMHRPARRVRGMPNIPPERGYNLLECKG